MIYFFRNNDFSFDEDAVKSGLKPHKLKVCVEALILNQVSWQFKSNSPRKWSKVGNEKF